MTVREAARELGVGVSSVKRWAEAGLLKCEKTPGGHRRIPRSEVDSLLRKRRGQYEGTEHADHALVDRLLSDASADEIERALLAERARAGSWGRAADQLAPVLAEIGERWARGAITVLQEHIASERFARAIARIADRFPVPPSAPTALLVVAEGEEHTLGLSLCEVVLREQGWKVQWGGRRTPVEEVRAFAERQPLGLIAVSASVVSSDPAQLARQAQVLAQVCRPARVRLFFGGRGAWPDPVSYGVRMQRFEDIAQAAAQKEQRT